MADRKRKSLVALRLVGEFEQNWMVWWEFLECRRFLLQPLQRKNKVQWGIFRFLSSESFSWGRWM